MPTVHLRVNDSATGRPTPVRLSVTGPDGTTYPPLGQFPTFATGAGEDVGGHVSLGGEAWYYTDGACELRLPAGVPLRVRVVKGPEYGSLDETVTLGPGQMALRFAVTRWSDVRAGGWYSGDTRCEWIGPHAALLEAAAVDLDVVNVLAGVRRVPSADGATYPAVPNLAAFSGQAPAAASDGRVVAVNTLNAHPVLGTVALLHSHRPVFPLTSGGDETDDYSVCDWCDQCHRKGGLAVWVGAFDPAGGLVGGEALVAAVLGKIDAIEVDGLPRAAALLPWVYALWDAGFPIPLVGGSGKDSNRTALGAPRTYARIPAGGAFTYKTWVESVRAGRTVVSRGPLLSLDVAAHGPGEAVEANGRPIKISARAASASPFTGLEIVADGAVVARAGAVVGDRWQAVVEFEYLMTESGWVAARCVTEDGGDAVAAHTSPVGIEVAGFPPTRRPAASAALAELVGRTRAWVEEHGQFGTAKREQDAPARCAAAVARLGQ